MRFQSIHLRDPCCTALFLYKQGGCQPAAEPQGGRKRPIWAGAVKMNAAECTNIGQSSWGACTGSVGDVRRDQKGCAAPLTLRPASRRRGRRRYLSSSNERPDPAKGEAMILIM